MGRVRAGWLSFCLAWKPLNALDGTVSVFFTHSASILSCKHHFTENLFYVDHAVAIVRSFLLPRWLGGKLATFSSSGSIDSVINERDARTRAPLMRRVKAILWHGGVFIHVLYVCFCVGAATSSTVRAFTTTKDNWQDRLFYMLTHAAWPPLVWLVASVACTVPIKYALFPPTMPDHEGLMRTEMDTGVAYPSNSAKQAKWGKTNLLHEGFYALISIYTTFLFIGSWFYKENEG